MLLPPLLSSNKRIPSIATAELNYAAQVYAGYIHLLPLTRKCENLPDFDYEVIEYDLRMLSLAMRTKSTKVFQTYVFC